MHGNGIDGMQNSVVPTPFSEGKVVRFESVRDLPERWREKRCSFLANVLAHEEAVDLISQILSRK
jgi:hypothetical protein